MSASDHATPQLLAIDDDADFLSSLKELLEMDGYSVSTLADATQAMSYLSESEWDCILLDVDLGELNGIDILNAIRNTVPLLPVIMVSGQSTIRIALDCVKLGAFDFYEKGTPTDRLGISIRNAIQHYHLQTKHASVKQKHQLIGNGAAMEQLKTSVNNAAITDAVVLITGESGTGKELVAHAVQQKSNRSDKPFITLNCAALPKDLIESELFGHVRGAFTSAISDRKGRFEEADSGTIFLDEIGELSPEAQAKLLRIIQNNEVNRLGENKIRLVDVRLIAATNKDLEKMVAEGGFREDLYYRLNVLRLRVPPLRERMDDLPQLTAHFLARFCHQHKKPIAGISSEAMTYLHSHNWNGNVRELENVVQRMVVLGPKGEDLSVNLVKQAIDQHTQLETVPYNQSLNDAIDQFTRHYIKHTLDFTGNNQAKAAEILGMDASNFSKKMKSLGMK